MKKMLKILYIAAFLFVLVFPLCTLNLKHNAASEFDNKMLAEFPALGDGFKTKFEEYLQDRIELRKPLIRFYLAMNEKLTGEVSLPDRSMGREGYVFFPMHENLSYTFYHDAFIHGVVQMKKYCEARGAKFYFLFNPEKISVYRRYLPTYVNYNDEWVDKLIQNLEAEGVTCISNRDLLIEKSETDQVFNVQYDPGHWNDRGMFFGMNNLWKTIQKDFPEVTEYSEDEFEVSTINEYYTLADENETLKETVPWYTIRTKYGNKTGEYSEIRISRNHDFFTYLRNISEDAPKYPKGLIFQGSYCNRKPAFFVGRFSDYIGVHDYENVLNLDYYFNLFQPDLVVFEAAEYTFSDGFFDHHKMAALDYNPALFEEGKNYNETLRELIDGAKRISSRAGDSFEVTMGIGYDHVVYSQKLFDVRYCYLISDQYAYDLKKNEDGYYEADIPRGKLKKGRILYYVDQAGDGHYAVCKDESYREFVSPEQSASGGVAYDRDSGIYRFTTAVEGNEFTSVELQLFTDDWDYVETLSSSGDKGRKTGDYVFTGEDGTYILRLKCNTNLQDENVYIRVNLAQGSIYSYAYEVTEIDSEHIVLKDFSFAGTEF